MENRQINRDPLTGITSVFFGQVYPEPLKPGGQLQWFSASQRDCSMQPEQTSFVQLNPFPFQLGSTHSHAKLPIELLQSAIKWQGRIEHSFISSHVLPSPAKPSLQTQL